MNDFQVLQTIKCVKNIMVFYRSKYLMYDKRIFDNVKKD
jgi:hypothetical protein